MYLFGKLLGKKIVAIRGLQGYKKAKSIEPAYILFDDYKTILGFEEQCEYTYHDCNGTARTLEIWENDIRWSQIYNDLKTYPKANIDIY